MPHWTSRKHHFHITRLKWRWCRLWLAFALLDSNSVLALACRQNYDKVKPFLPAKNPALYQILGYFWKSPAPGVDNRFLHPYLPSSVYQFFCCRFYYFLPSLFFVLFCCWWWFFFVLFFPEEPKQSKVGFILGTSSFISSLSAKTYGLSILLFLFFNKQLHGSFAQRLNRSGEHGLDAVYQKTM